MTLRCLGEFNWLSQRLTLRSCDGEEQSGVEFVPVRLGRVGVGTRLRGGGSIGSGSGKRSLEAHRARTLRSRRVFCRALVSGGSARVVGCRLSASRRRPGAICRSPSERRSRSCSPAVPGCERSRVSWIVHRRRSRGSCNAILRSDVAALSIEPRPRTGMLSVALNVPAGEARGQCAAARLCASSAFWEGAAD
jgi:hypothetical protein